MFSQRSASRKLVFWLHAFISRKRLWRVPIRLFQLTYLSILALTNRSREYRGIRLIAFPPYGVDSLAVIVDALELLRRSDPRRFRRVEQHTKRILLGDFKALGFYTPIGRICGLTNLSPSGARNPLIAYGYAATIVHEATHGLLHILRFAPTRANLKRIERIAVREQARFLAKFPQVKENVSQAYGYADRRKLGKRREN